MSTETITHRLNKLLAQTVLPSNNDASNTQAANNEINTRFFVAPYVGKI